MKIQSLLQSLLSLLLLFSPLQAQQLPNRTALIMYELEQFLTETSGINERAFERPITPCSNYAENGSTVNNNTLGRQSAAQWIRNAFHDFNTANVHNGTGGIDASIGFEADRSTNAGPMIPDSMFFFGFFVSDMVSMADLVALGMVLALGTCGGPYVPLKGGRVDATEAGPLAFCNPDSSLNQTLGVFTQAGMTQQEGITLVACGHTMGGVHYNQVPESGTLFADIVGNETISPTNLDGRVTFDNTLGVHDYNTIKQYVTNTGNRGGPLVTSFNETVRSDYRLYSSDGNVTVKRLATSNDYYEGQCQKVIGKMLDTVPAGVDLTPAIEPFEYKPINISLNIDWKGDETLSGFIRYLQKSGAPAAPSSLPVTLIDRSGRPNEKVIGTTNTTFTGNSIFGPTTFYYFSIEFSSSVGLSGLEVGGQILVMQDGMFVVPALSSVSPGLSGVSPLDSPQVFTINITTALLTEKNTQSPPYLTATFAKPVLLTNAVGNRGIDKSFSTSLPYIGRAGPFSLYSAVSTEHNITESPQLVRSSIDVIGEGVSSSVMFFELFSLLAGY